MRRALLLLACSAGLGLIACSDKSGPGGNGGSSGSGGSGGTDVQCHTNADCEPLGTDQACKQGQCVPGNQECIPACKDSIDRCVSGTCVHKYTLRFIDPPAATGTKFSLRIEVRPYPGESGLKLSELTVTCLLAGVDCSGSLVVSLVPDQDNVFELDLDLTHRSSSLADLLPLSVTAYPTSASSNNVSLQVQVDNKGPGVTPDRLPAMGFKRNDPIVATAAVDDLHMVGGTAMAKLVGPGEPDPKPPECGVSDPVDCVKDPSGWVLGTRMTGSGDRLWSFTLDQRHTSLPALSGNLVVWFWTRDQFFNSSMFHQVQVDFQAKVSRDAWSGEVPNPVVAGIKGGGGGAGGQGAGITNVPAVDKLGQVVVLVAGTKDNFALFDPQTGVRRAYFASVSGGDPLAPVVAASGNYYVVSFDHFDLYNLNAGSLTRLNTCATQNHSGVTSPPTLLLPGTQELLGYSRSDGSMAQIGADTPTVPITCTPEMSTAVLGNPPGASNTSPVATVNNAGQTLVIMGGTAPKTLSTFSVGSDGMFTQLSTFSPAGYDVLRDVPLALDHDTVYAAPRFRMQAAAFQYTDSFDAPPTERAFFFENAENDKIGPPIVSAHAIVYPTSKGLRALPRFGPWAQDAVLSPDEVFKAPAVAGEGDLLYAISYTGKLYTIKYRELPAPTLEVEWSLQIGGMNETFSASPTLTCSGTLVMASELGKVHAIIVDSRGLDPNAPWPKVLHDTANTGNAATSLACP